MLIFRLLIVFFTVHSKISNAEEIRLTFPIESEDQHTFRQLRLGLAFQAYGDQNRAITFLKVASLGARTHQMRLIPDLAIARIYLSQGAYRTALPILADVYEQTSTQPDYALPIRASALILIAEVSARNYDLNHLRLAADDLTLLEAPEMLLPVRQKIRSTGEYYLAMLAKFNGIDELAEPLRKTLKAAEEEEIKNNFSALTQNFINESKKLLQYPSITSIEEKQKSPFIAGLLSAVVPGSGYVYSGNWQNGLSALFFTVGTAVTANWALRQKEPVFGAAMAGVSGLFYLGQLSGSVRHAILRNQAALKKFQDGVIVQFTPKSTLTFSADGLTLKW